MKIIPWSWTLYETYETCPRLCYETRITKNFRDDPNNETMLWANAVHSGLEHRLKHGTPLPERMSGYEKYAAHLSFAPGDHYVEEEVAITNPFCGFNGAYAQPASTGYWDNDCWHRGKDDFTAVNGHKAVVIDHKTGKPKQQSLQLTIAAARVMIKFPEVTEVKTCFAWLVNGTFTIATYTRDQLPAMFERFRKTVQDMEWSEKNNAWPAKPGGLCKKSRKPGSTYGGCIVATCPHSEHFRG